MKRINCSGRLIAAIVTTIAQEVAIALIVLLGLPEAGIDLSVTDLVVILVIWTALCILLYRAGSKALGKKPLPMTSMNETTGKVVQALNPRGVVKIKGELWDAESEDGEKINACEDVVVVSTDRMRLTVRRVQKTP